MADKLKGEELNLRQERFCQLYATDKEFFGNGVSTYSEVYDIDKTKPGWNKTAQVCASQLLSNPIIYNRINELLQEGGLNDNFVDKQLLYLISQQADGSSKLGAIKEYNKLKQRIIEKIEHSGNVQSPEIIEAKNKLEEIAKQIADALKDKNVN